MQKRHQRIVSKSDACLSLNPLTKNTYNKYENVVSKATIWWKIHQIVSKNDAKIKSAQIDLEQIVIWSYVSRTLKSVVLGLDKVYMMTHAPAVVKSPNGGTSQSLIGEINSEIAIRTRSIENDPLAGV